MIYDFMDNNIYIFLKNYFKGYLVIKILEYFYQIADRRKNTILLSFFPQGDTHLWTFKVLIYFEREKQANNYFLFKNK